MIIESTNKSKYTNLIILIFFLIFMSIFAVLTILEKSNLSIQEILIVTFVGVLLGTFFIIKVQMFHFRKIELDKTGLSIKFLFIKKKYTWEQLKIKRIELYETQKIKYTYEDKRTKVVVFSPKRIIKPKSLLPVSYFIFPFANPFSYVFINLTGNDNFPAPRGYYEFDEDIFMDKMKEWGVELDNVVIKKGWKPPALS